MNKEKIRTADFHIFIEFRPWFCLGAKSFAKALTAHPNPSRKREGRRAGGAYKEELNICEGRKNAFRGFYFCSTRQK
jgi:hypothetical protein